MGTMKRDFDLSALATASTHTPTQTDAKSILDTIRKLQIDMANHAAFSKPSTPDRDGNVYPDSMAGMLGGMQVVVSDMIPKERLVTHKRERKWCHRLRFEKERRFNITYETVPNTDVYMLPGKMVVSQEQFNKIRDGVPATYSMGMAVDQKADPFPYEPERPSFFKDRGYEFPFDINPRNVALIRGGV
jgi:hypothetical protein